MPVVNREVERKIVREGKRQGKSEEYIRRAVLRYRERELAKRKQNAPKKDFLTRASDLSKDRFLEPLSDFMFGSTKTLGDALARKALRKGGLNIPVSKAEKELEKHPVATPLFSALEVAPTKTVSLATKPLKGLGRLLRLDKIPAALKESAIKKYTEVLKPTKEHMKVKTARIVPELLKRKQRIGSIKGLKEKSGKFTDYFGQKIDDVIDALPEGETSKTDRLADILENKKEAQKIKNAKGKKITINKGNIATIKDLEETVKALGEDVPRKEMIKLRRIWDKTIDESKGFQKFSPPFEIGIKKELTAALREELAKDVPELAKVSKEFSFWKTVQEVTAETEKRTKPHTGLLKPLVTSTAGIMGASGEGSAGARGVNALIAAGVTKGVVSAITSPLWKTVDAGLRHKLAKALADGKPEKVAKVSAQIVAHIKNVSRSINRSEDD